MAAVAVLGMGRMGKALAGRLLDAGNDVVVWNRTPGKAPELLERGATEAADVHEAVAAAEIALTMLSDDAAVCAVVLEGGLVEALRPGAAYVDCSTVAPGTSRTLADEAGADRFVAAPILGAPGAVTAGNATVLTGGADELVERLGWLWPQLGGQHRHCGSPEQAATMKLTSNLLMLSELVALSEVIVLGEAAGIARETLRDFLSNSPMLPPGLSNRLDRLIDGVHDAWWTAPLGAKDVRLAAEMGEQHGVSLPVARLVQQRFQLAADGGYADADITAVIELLRNN